MGIFARLFGICRTRTPSDPSAWRHGPGRIELDMDRSPELQEAGGAIRLEGRNLPFKVLVIQGADQKLHAFENRCTHGGRRLDPGPDQGTVQCCSLGKSTFDYQGQRLSGSAKEPIRPLQVTQENDQVFIALD